MRVTQRQFTHHVLQDAWHTNGFNYHAVNGWRLLEGYPDLEAKVVCSYLEVSRFTPTGVMQAALEFYDTESQLFYYGPPAKDMLLPRSLRSYESIIFSTTLTREERRYVGIARYLTVSDYWQLESILHKRKQQMQELLDTLAHFVKDEVEA